MALNFTSNCLQVNFLHKNPISLPPPSISFSVSRSRLRRSRRCLAVRGRGSSYSADLLRKPVVSPALVEEVEEEDDEEEVEHSEDGEAPERWVDWEDQILADTVPLVGFVRMVLHSGKYEPGDRISPEHERTILERLLPYHPECEEKIGDGVDYITIGYHPDFEGSRCLFIVRKDGDLVDFSYWKCIKGLIRKNYPLYADSFIFKHFNRSKRND